MKEKLKTILTAFSGFIVYSALLTSTSYMTDDAATAGIISAAAFILLGGLYSKVVIGPIGPKKTLSKKFLLISFATVLLYVFVSMFTSNSMAYALMNSGAVGQTDASSEVLQTLSTVALVRSILFAPVAEELVFRGYMYRQLSKFNAHFALIFSSAFFAVWHGTIIHLYAAFFGGIIFCKIYEKTQKLRYSILAHIIFNGCTVLFGSIAYPNFVIEPWWVITMNCLLFIALVILFKSDAELEIKSKSSELTPEQKAERKRISDIVDSVMDEHKSRH